MLRAYANALEQVIERAQELPEIERPTHHRRPPLTTASARRNHASPQFSMRVLQHIPPESRRNA